MRKAIVTVIIGNYDTLKQAPKYTGWDAILITNNDYKDLKGWKLHKVESKDFKKDSRYYKWNTHKTLPEYDLVCYIDGSMELIKEPPNRELFVTHPKRRTVRAESQMILRLKKESKQLIDSQLSFYRGENFTDANGLYQNGFFVREHKEKINNVCEMVYSVTEKYSYRDQIALPFALFKTGYKFSNLSNGRINKHFKIHKHGAEIFPMPNVHHITPGRSDLNLGKAINDIIKSLPDNDWICLRDIDTMPGYHEMFFAQCEQIALAGDFDLIGCVTNRLGLKYQLHNEVFSEDTNWLNHRKIAKERYKTYGSGVMGTEEYIAGLFMMFRKSLWASVGGFPEGGIKINNTFIDYQFSKAVRDGGFKTGIAEGVYLIHLYRPEARNPRRSIGHLI